jgi:hypothetical protein
MIKVSGMGSTDGQEALRPRRRFALAKGRGTGVKSPTANGAGVTVGLMEMAA